MKLGFTYTNLAILLLGSALFLIISCGKEHSGTGTEEEQQIQASKVSSESDGEAEIVFNSFFDDEMGVNAEVGMGGTGIFGRNEACPDVTVLHTAAPAIFPIKITLNFGTNGCVGNDGHRRRGKIITVYTDRLVNAGAIATTEFDNFYFDDTKVEGVHKVMNISTNNQGNRIYKVMVIDGKLIRPNGDYSLWTSEKTITQFEGSGTPFLPLDDQYKITGGAHGKVLRGNLLVLWNSNITEPLIKRFNCRWLVKGIVRTVRESTPATGPWVAELDFSPGPQPSISGYCDNIAVITINGVRHQITLP